LSSFLSFKNEFVRKKFSLFICFFRALLDFPASAALVYRWSRYSRSDASLDADCMLA